MIVQTGETLLGAVLIIEGLNHLLAVVHFLNVSVELAQQLLLLFVMLAAGFHDARCAEQGQRHHDDGDDGQLWADCQHHQKDADGGDHLCDNGCEVLTDGVVDGIHIVGDDAEDIAVGVGVVIIQF